MRRVTALFLLAIGTAPAHRLDEYLEATLVSVNSDRMSAEMRLVPGVAVLPVVLAAIDTNGDGRISDEEQNAYSRHVMRDLAFTIDGHRLRLTLESASFPNTEDLRTGLGEITLKFAADLPQNGSHRRLVFENRHQPRIGAYLVNCLVPSDPRIRIEAQKRNYSQSSYELDYELAGTAAERLRPGGLLGGLALLLSARLILVRRRAVQTERSRSKNER